jgi:O-antigen/teichoic acid export membrane protein
LSVPHQNLMSLSLGFGAVGLAGLIYAATIAASMRRHSGDYVPVQEDWLWHVILPTLVYGVLFVMALLLWLQPEQSLYGVAASSALLLFIGIHNAWDVAVSISVRKQKDPS